MYLTVNKFIIILNNKDKVLIVPHFTTIYIHSCEESNLKLYYFIPDTKEITALQSERLT